MVKITVARYSPKVERTKIIKLVVLVSLALNLSACLGTVVGAVVDTTIEVVKVPFKVGRAVIDVATDDDFTDQQFSTEPVDSAERTPQPAADERVGLQ